METEKEHNDKIMALTTKIMEKHPELSKFLDEMPETIHNESDYEINNKALEDIYESLKDLLRNPSIALIDE